MARLHTIGKTIITVYANDHAPPHFHILNPDFEALVKINDLSLYAGFLKGSAARVAMEWAQQNIELIRAEWNRINPMFPA